MIYAPEHWICVYTYKHGCNNTNLRCAQYNYGIYYRGNLHTVQHKKAIFWPFISQITLYTSTEDPVNDVTNLIPHPMNSIFDTRYVSLHFHVLPSCEVLLEMLKISPFV